MRAKGQYYGRRRGWRAGVVTVLAKNAEEVAIFTGQNLFGLLSITESMHLIVTSGEDIASMNIRQKLLSLADWKDVGTFRGTPALSAGGFYMVFIPGIHLEAEALDSEVKKALGIEFDCMIFASRHKSQSGLRTLTVHPVGNYGKAEFGGREGRLAPTAPMLMTQALLRLKKSAGSLDFQISFECTHHGPYVETPSFFIEIGSDEDAWKEEEPAKKLAEVILSLDKNQDTLGDKIAIGVGGGHYAPRHSEVALAKKISFGHMLPNYACGNASSDMVKQAIERTPGCEAVYFHRKSMEKPEYRRIKALFEDAGISAVSSGDLEDRLCL
jgi:D-aminoacyl-tRNA deacylase